MINDGVLSGAEQNGNVLILLTLIASRLWLCLLRRFLRFSLIHKGSYGSDSVASENQPLQLRLKYFDSYQVAYMSVFHWNDPTDQARWSDITRIKAHQSDRQMHPGKGFIGSFDAPWSLWSWITDPGADHPKNTYSCESNKTLQYIYTLSK